MTLEELKNKIDSYIGLVSVAKSGRTRDTIQLIYKSSTGIVLFDLTVSHYDSGWEFCGRSSALPDSWGILCSVHEAK